MKYIIKPQFYRNSACILCNIKKTINLQNKPVLTFFKMISSNAFRLSASIYYVPVVNVVLLRTVVDLEIEQFIFHLVLVPSLVKIGKPFKISW